MESQNFGSELPRKEFAGNPASFSKALGDDIDPN